ncbi:MAG: tyrosine-protein phosphatase [Pseudomonadota bacterium]
MKLFKRISDWERDLRASYNTDLSTPENRRRAQIYNLWFDHAILRTLWTNFFEIAPGVYRSNHPTHKRFEKMKAMGIKSVLNLRGSFGAAHYLVEEESCRELGLNLVSVNMQARHAPPGEELLALIEAFRTIEKPFVMHCKSGADRAGFAAAIYLLVIEGRPMPEARKQLGLRYLHVRQSKTGVLDHILDVYEARNARDPISFEDWLRTDYEFRAMQADYLAHHKPWF